MSDKTPNPETEKPTKRGWHLDRFMRDLAVLSGGELTSKILGFLAFAYLARVLTVEDYGMLETIVGMAAIGLMAIDFGTGAVGVRRLAQKGSDISQTLGAVISARLIMSLLVIPALALTYLLLVKPAGAETLIWLFAMSLWAAPFSMGWLLQSQEKMTAAAFGPALKMIVFALVVFALAPGRNGLAMVGVAEMTAMLVMVLYLTFISARVLKIQRPSLSVPHATNILQESSPLGLASFVRTAGLYVPVLIVAAISGGQEAGAFGAAHRLITSLVTFSFTYYFNIYPLFTRKYGTDNKGLTEILDASVRVTAWAGISAALILTMAAEPLMTLIFGKAYAGAATTFQIMVWMGALVLMSGNARWMLVTSKRQSALLLAQIVSAVVTIGLALVLVPIADSIGAAIAVTAGAVCMWIVAHFSTISGEFRPQLSPVLLPAALALAAFASMYFWSLEAWPATGAATLIMVCGVALNQKVWKALRILAAAKNEV